MEILTNVTRACIRCNQCNWCLSEGRALVFVRTPLKQIRGVCISLLLFFSLFPSLTPRISFKGGSDPDQRVTVLEFVTSTIAVQGFDMSL